tara:strand:+ start:1808 stop:2389 length:582 start_codon:yes stop_codon:yes gene_type:complete
MFEIPVNINKISYDPEQKGYLVSLKSTESEHFLNILVGTKAAKEISLAKEGVTFPRPSTHELLVDIIDNFEIKIKKIIITEYKLSTFFAKIIFFNRNYGEVVIDGRPSDAITLSLRANCSLYVNEDLFNMSISDNNKQNNLNVIESDSEVYENNNLMLKKLNQNLDKAIEFEEYEKAAKLRDQINSLKKDSSS